MEAKERSEFEMAGERVHKPAHSGPLASFNAYARITGPCGETMEFWLLVDGSKIEKASFVTDGCGASHACGNTAVWLAEGKSVEEAASLEQRHILDALGGLPEDSEHCALLAADTLKAACADYRDHQTASPAEKTCGTCGDSSCSSSHRLSGESDQDFEGRRRLQERLCRIRRKIVVLSGKGGVGKSTVAVNLAVALAQSGRKVGLLDVDIHGPSVPTMLGLEGETVRGRDGELIPVDLEGLQVMSLGFFLRNQDDPVIWRGPMKMGVIKQFLQDVAWGALDFLIIDSPPGTGDEPLSVCQLLGKVDGAVIVTTPQKVSTVDVRKSISFCRQLGVPVLGVVENMSGFACPHCGEVTAILRTGGGERLARDMGVTFLGAIPLDPMVAQSGDEGRAFIRHGAPSPTVEAIREIIQPIATLIPSAID